MGYFCGYPHFYPAKVILFCDIDKYFYDRLCFFPKITYKFRDLKECDGTHFERCARRVPTLRDKHKHRTKEGDLWAFGRLSMAFFKRVSIIMLQKSSARKGSCAEGWRMWRVKWYIQHAGSVVFTKFPA